MSVLLAQISASGSAEATFRVEEMVFPDMLKASFLSVSQLPEAKSCTEAAQPLLLLDLNLWRFEGGVWKTKDEISWPLSTMTEILSLSDRNIIITRCLRII